MSAENAAAGRWTRRRALLVLAALAGLLVVAYVGAYVAVGPGVARGTTVLGVGIGDRSTAEAARVLRRELADEARTPVPVRVGEATGRVDPGRAGLRLDAAATAAAARARSWNPLELLDALVGGEEVTPVALVDRTALRAEVDRLAGRMDREPTDAGVRFVGRGEVARVEPQPGISLRRPAAARALATGYLTPAHLAGRGVRLPARITEPAIGRAELERAIREVAEPAVSAPVLLTVEGTTVEIPPVAIAEALTFDAGPGGVLEPRLDGERLHAAVAEDLSDVERPARDAGFDVSSGRPRVVPAKPGRGVDPAALAEAVLPVLTATGPARAVTLPLSMTEPELTTAAAEGLGVRQLVAEYTTYYPSDFPPRLTNIHRAADLMDGTLVLPGKTFSFNRTVGERTAERGFAAGFIIDNGRLEVDYGGGVSQLATTTFNAAFFAGLEIVEHNPHSFYISRYPEGRESTIAWGVKDLRFRNDSPHGVYLTTAYTNSSVTVRVWGTKRFRIESTTSPRYDVTPYRTVYDPDPPGTDPGDCVATEGVPGFRVIVKRLFYQQGTLVRTEEFRTRYAPEHEVICGRSAPAPQPSASSPQPSATADPQG